MRDQNRSAKKEQEIFITHVSSGKVPEHLIVNKKDDFSAHYIGSY